MQEMLPCDTINGRVVKRLQEERNHAEDENYMYAWPVH